MEKEKVVSYEEMGRSQINFLLLLCDTYDLVNW
jgi:hypothetical protein